MIEKLTWDSDFFGYPVGKLVLESSDVFPGADALSNYQLVYVFSKNGINDLQNPMAEVDRKTTLTKSVNPDAEYPFHTSIEEYEGGGDDSLRKLAIESGIYSRFNKDKHFKNNEFERLYTAWIENSIAKRDAGHLLVFREEGIIQGFVTLTIDTDRSHIGLIAVDRNYRGKGIGLALLYAACCQTKVRELPVISVVTQLENVPAIELYFKAGFEISETIHVYHIWKLP
jgi:dTDP-4-amino-4,6-dideoxy-D-galactose acyltransferase